MSRQLLVLITVFSLFAVFSIAQAQQPTVSDQPIFVLTEEQINAEFRLPNTTTRRISNLEVEVEEDGLHVSFQMTITRDGTTNTLNIIAILIGLFDQPRVSSLELENTLISSFVAPSSLRREVTTLLLQSWNTYAASLFDLSPGEMLPITQFEMADGKLVSRGGNN